MWLPIDTNVLVDASGQGMADYADASYQLLRRSLLLPDFRLAIDPKGKLRHEYENRINAVMYAHHWLTELNKNQRIQLVPKVPIPKGAKVELLEVHLHQEDFHLVEAALGSDGLIITRDFNSFQKPVIRILRRSLGITVLSPQEGLSLLLSNRAEEEQ